MKRILFITMFLCLLCPSVQAEKVRFLKHPKIKVAKVANLDFATAIDNPVWQKQPAHPFMFYITRTDDIARAPEEGAYVQYLYDDKYLYVRGHFIDSDITTSASAHGGAFYSEGDLLEIFIKNAGHNYYWEVYGTPNKLRTRYHYPARSTVGLPSGFALNDCPILVDARLDGTLNDPTDVDKSWDVLVAIPISELEKHGAKFAPGNRWTIFSSRYNYTRHLPERELSSFPQCALTYHAYEYYAEIEFVKQSL